MTSIIIKEFDHYQNTQSHYQIDDLTIHLLLDKICCEHVYLSQDDEKLISHKKIKTRDFIYKSRAIFRK
jgi:hypothetical protein